MIFGIKGILIAKSTNLAIIECAGLSYGVYISLNTYKHLPKLLENTSLYIELIIKEDSHVLYGFYTEEEKSIFKRIIKINSVGAKLALAILSDMNPKELISTIKSDNAQRLSMISGIGKKTADRIILDLKDFCANLIEEISGNREDIISALISLGYTRQESLIRTKSMSNDVSIEDGIRIALKKKQ